MNSHTQTIRTWATGYWYESAIIVQYLKCAYKYICISLEKKTTHTNTARKREKRIVLWHILYKSVHLLPISVVTNNKTTPLTVFISCLVFFFKMNTHTKTRFTGVSASHSLQHHHTLFWGFYFDFTAAHLSQSLSYTSYGYSLICWLYWSHGDNYFLWCHFSVTLDVFMRCFSSYVKILP